MHKLTSPWLHRSRWVHRCFGVIAGVYLAAMGLSGILLNHPDWIAGISLQRTWLPGDYEIVNWSRNALRGRVRTASGGVYWYGESGIWKEMGGGISEVPGKGFPRSVYYKDTRALLSVDEKARGSYLLAGTRGGLYIAKEENSCQWGQVPLPGSSPAVEVVDVLLAESRVIVMTRSRVYAAAAVWPFSFQDVTPSRAEEREKRLPLFRLIFHAHSGAAWGDVGRLMVDGLGALLILFCTSGVAFWWGKKCKRVARGAFGRLVRGGLRWHLRWGLWLAVPFLLLAVSGFFQRPPFLIAIMGNSYPAKLHPAPREPNPWHDLLRKAAYDPLRHQVLLATADGFFCGDADFQHPFMPMGRPPPVSVMGATVFEREGAGLYWVGSMGGLYAWDPVTGRATDAFTGEPPGQAFGRPVGDTAVTGMFRDRGVVRVVDYFRGVLDATNRSILTPMPSLLEKGGCISLWHVLFEFHNGRFFSFLLGWWSWILVPLGGLTLSSIVLTGTASALVRRRRKGRARVP